MATLTTGRALDAHGSPIEGTGFSYDREGPLADLLAQRVSPLLSQPATGEWIFALVLGADTGGEFERGVGVFPPGNAGPPAHIHPGYDERFEIIQGEFIYTIDGREERFGPGDRAVASKGATHTFRCVGNEVGAVIAETRPAARTGAVIATLFGMAHAGLLTRRGQPKPLQAMVIGSEYADDTVMASPPPSITVPVAKLLAPIGRRLGLRSSYDEYVDDAFWNSHVEQPGMPTT